VRRLDRKLCPRPRNWDARLERSLPDSAEFRRQATAFQKLAINSPKRRKGFAAFAPHVLVPALWGRHKEAIAAMSSHKCAYCEGPINALRASHVEHFKPKSLFPLMADEWTKYFLGCPGCNGAKADKWPKRGGYLRPDRGDPSRHFVFEEDGTARAAMARSAADLMLTDFDLNRTWLVDRRRFNIEATLRMLDDAIRLHREGAKAAAKRLAKTIFRNASAPAAAYSAALEQCFWRAWKESLPKSKL
jgi:uncharacterized protein (TIGR02646 family)